MSEEIEPEPTPAPESTQSLLSSKFPPETVKQRTIFRRGKHLVIDYIPGYEVIKRLNGVFGLKWSFEVKDKFIDIPSRQVAVLGSLSVVIEGCNIIKEQWGGSVISTYYDTGEVIALYDDLKIAATDALKKCATEFGVALYLYEQDDNTDDEKMKEPPPDVNALEKKRIAISSQKAPVKEFIPSTNAQIAALYQMLSAEHIDVNAMLEELKVDDMAKIGYNEMGEILTKRHMVWNSFRS